MSKITRAQAIEIVGESAIDAAANVNCEQTGRITNDGTVEFASRLETKDKDGDAVTLIAYFYQAADDIDRVEDLSDLDWSIDSYEIR